MKARARNRNRWVSLLLMALLLVLVGYNYWSYRCGRCTLASMLVLSPPAILLLVLNFVACGGLFALKFRNRQRLQSKRCRCGSVLHDSWGFCPDCGSGRRSDSIQGR